MLRTLPPLYRFCVSLFPEIVRDHRHAPSGLSEGVSGLFFLLVFRKRAVADVPYNAFGLYKKRLLASSAEQGSRSPGATSNTVMPPRSPRLYLRTNARV